MINSALHDNFTQKISQLMDWDYDDDGNYAWDDAGEAHRPSLYENDSGYILDRIAVLGWAVTVYTGPYPGHDGPINRVCIMRQPGDAVLDGTIDAIAATRPLAICEAFIQAMERWGDG